MSSNDNKPSFWQILASVAAAAFGVQSNKNRERDFQQNRVLPYIIAAVAFTLALVLALMLVVKAVLWQI